MTTASALDVLPAAPALPPRAVPPRVLEIGASDGETLAADLFTPPGRVVARALVAPAMGVKRSFYAPFAAHLAAHGIATITVDYRGIGGSNRPLRTPARLAQWGELDLAAATRELEALPGGAGTPLVFVGHSIGGQLFGLMQDAPYRAALFVGSQSGYYGHWSGLARAAMAGLWFGAVPAVTAVAGKLPMRALGQGEDVPAGVARDWAAWGRDRRYVGVHLRERPEAGYSTWGGRLRAVAIADDPYAPWRAVEALAGMYTAADVEVTGLRARDVEARSIGHFGWFRPRFASTLWADGRRWLLRAAGAEA